MAPRQEPRRPRRACVCSLAIRASLIPTRKRTYVGGALSSLHAALPAYRTTTSPAPLACIMLLSRANETGLNKVAYVLTKLVLHHDSLVFSSNARHKNPKESTCLRWKWLWLMLWYGGARSRTLRPVSCSACKHGFDCKNSIASTHCSLPTSWRPISFPCIWKKRRSWASTSRKTKFKPALRMKQALVLHLRPQACEPASAR